jgi:hypothetical protein
MDLMNADVRLATQHTNCISTLNPGLPYETHVSWPARNYLCIELMSKLKKVKVNDQCTKTFCGSETITTTGQLRVQCHSVKAVENSCAGQVPTAKFVQRVLLQIQVLNTMQ